MFPIGAKSCGSLLRRSSITLLRELLHHQLDSLRRYARLAKVVFANLKPE